MNLPLPLLGSFFFTKETNFTLNIGAFVPIMEPNPQRWGFIITQINNATTEIDLTADNAVGPIAIIGTAGERFERVFRDWGCLPQLGWFAGTPVGPSNICVLEVLYMPPAQPSSQPAQGE